MNRKIFGVKLFSQKTFALVIYGILVRLDWVLTVRIPAITLRASMKFLSMVHGAFRISSAMTSLLKAKLRIIDKITTNLSLNVVKMSQKRYFFIDSSDKITLLFQTALARAKYYVSSHLTLTMAITVVSSAATFIKLSVYDLLTLGDMDGALDDTTLGSLDAV